MRRRTLLAWLIGAASGTMGFMAAVPALVAALSPRRWRSDSWRALGPLAQFPVSRVVRVIVPPRAGEFPVAHPPARAVYVWLTAPSQAVVFSPTCTDLGCSVTFDPGSEFFYCPCHGGTFDKAGQPVAGPPARALHRYATRIRRGLLEIDVASVPPVA